MTVGLVSDPYVDSTKVCRVFILRPFLHELLCLDITGLKYAGSSYIGMAMPVFRLPQVG
jgi:hypothetical protein